MPELLTFFPEGFSDGDEGGKNGPIKCEAEIKRENTSKPYLLRKTACRSVGTSFELATTKEGNTRKYRKKGEEAGRKPPRKWRKPLRRPRKPDGSYGSSKRISRKKVGKKREKNSKNVRRQHTRSETSDSNGPLFRPAEMAVRAASRWVSPRKRVRTVGRKARAFKKGEFRV